ncbi:hypothetical protein GGR55DRAFT_229884 [Xylaria sp. FL0064]|nr:hypothetical protein GGR55DRAFT_229884 [Xylaria sp. FL0064]
MSIGKWKFSGSRKHSTSSSGNSDTTVTSSSSSTSTPATRTSAPTSASSNGSSNRNSKTTSSSLSSSPFSWFRSNNHNNNNNSPRRSSKKRKSATMSRDDPAFARLNKPLTPQNLEHQKLFSAFEWTSDDDGYRNSRQRQRRRSSLSISPCATRDKTVDEFYADGCGYGPQDTLSRSLACLSTRDDPGDGYDNAS